MDVVTVEKSKIPSNTFYPNINVNDIKFNTHVLLYQNYRTETIYLN